MAFGRRRIQFLNIRESCTLNSAPTPETILSRMAELHDLNVAPRDIGDHSLWVVRPAKVVMAGFPAAYYPEMKTVGTFREKVKVEQSVLPEDREDASSGATPYRRDVFML